MFDHTTVLKKEAVDGLDIKSDGIYVDCTLGGGGHSEAILSHLTTGHLFAFEHDPFARLETEQRLVVHRDKLTIIPENFRHLKRELQQVRGVCSVAGVLYDLGVSSPQFDQAERGFSYQYDGPLDMRMNSEQALSAKNVINEWSYEQLVSIFFKYGEEKFSKSIARKIEMARREKVIETTGEVVELIKAAIPAPARRKGGHPAKRVFQALRIAVNDELQVFEDSLEQAIDMVSIGGRISVITFHSLEDRLCKQAFLKHSRLPDLPPGLPIIPEGKQPLLRLVNKKPIIPSDEEVENNRRSRSAKLRIAEKLRPNKED